ncbi:sulfotransferase [Marivirga arenosa]|uniref:Sulfotransferase n=1 Tax=Marivirga arenosa TaxID=3059076 RepID=A0AA51N6E0_9BACT|nr:sulfotransferase [Marivirga sp. ABR2-2]WMN06809.1 sulfotransferase [Marivirga sp. ABR2-2]
MSKKPLKVRIYTRFRNSVILNAFLNLTQKPLKPKKWVFILGCYNSGTTLLAELLSQHPQLTVLPDEGVMLTNQLKRPEDFGWRRMWWKCAEMIRSSDLKLNKKKAQIVKGHWAFFIPKTSSIVVEKSISNILRIHFFQKYFTDAYFIHIRRNPYAVAEGIQRKAKPMGAQAQKYGVQYPLELCIQQWVASQTVFENEKEKIQNLYELSYEDFTVDPQKLANQICDFLGIRYFDPRIFTQKMEVHGKSMKIMNQNDKSFQRLSKQDWGLINQNAEKAIKHYGYYQAEKPQ